MIKLSKKGGYALKAIIYIAKSEKDLVNISQISKDEKISEAFLRRIISDFEKHWIIKTIKWRNWWVKIWKDFKDISLYDILLSSGEELNISKCTKWIECSNITFCSTTNILNSLQKWFNSLLKMQTLDKLICN